MTETKWRGRALAAGAGLSIAALTLAACSAPADTTPTEAPAADGAQVIIAETNEFSSANFQTANGNLDINQKIAYLTRADFFYIDDTFEIIPDTTFGTMEITSEEPLRVTYTLAGDRVWSDGQAITSADLVLGWAAYSGALDDATLDDDGNVLSGTKYFDYAGSTEGLNTSKLVDVTDLSVTVEYDTPFVDWNTITLMSQPAHVVAEKAGVELDALVDAIVTAPRGDAASPIAPNETIKAAADFWNTGFDMTSLPSDESLYLASGAFKIQSWEPTQSMTLVRNESYTGMQVPAFDTLVVRFIGDSQAQVTALQNGEVDVIVPQASRDTLELLNNLPGVTTLLGDQLAYDHIDLTQAGVFADQNVREAFLKTIPRQQILDALITPVNPEAEVLNSQLFIPAQTAYQDAVKANGSDAYNEVDIDGAKALLNGATPTVRILHSSANPNRVTAFEMIQASAQQAGFVVESVGREDWSAQLGSDIYDAAIFGWISPGIGNGTIPQIFASFGGSNFNQYANATVDQVARTIPVTLDAAEIDTLTITADTELFKDGYGLPLFQSAGLEAHSDRVSGVTYMGNQTGPIWNFWEWTVSE